MKAIPFFDVRPAGTVLHNGPVDGGAIPLPHPHSPYQPPSTGRPGGPSLPAASRPLWLAALFALSFAPALSARTIAAAEYYFNTDPGPGNGTPIPVADAQQTVRLTVDVPPATIAALPDGVHFLVARVRDDEGNWSVAFSRPVHKEAPPAEDPLLARVEYQWHQDGQPVSAAVPLAAPAGSVSSFWLPESPMPEGEEGDAFQLVVTPYDSAGNRGISATREVTLAPPPALADTLAAAFPGAPTEVLAPEGNPLGDVFNNLQKYYLGLDPVQIEGGSAVSLVVPETPPAAEGMAAPFLLRALGSAGESGRMGLRFQRSRYTRGVAGVVETSTSLSEGSWEPVETVEEVSPLDAFTDEVIVRMPEPEPGETRRFLRLRVEETP